jgi:hypothetical protein
MEKAEADPKGSKYFAGAQAASAPVFLYELLVIHAEPNTKRIAPTVTRNPRRNARFCRASHDIRAFFARLR